MSPSEADTLDREVNRIEKRLPLLTRFPVWWFSPKMKFSPSGAERLRPFVSRSVNGFGVLFAGGAADVSELIVKA